MAKALNGTALNGGLGSYGLSQMLLRAEQLVPKYRPEYLLIQYSSWLVTRSIMYFDEPISGKRAKPYFFIKKDDSLLIHPPVFENNMFSYNISAYRNQNKGFLDFAEFFIEIGCPLFLFNDRNMILFYSKRLLGIIPTPVEDRDAVVRYVYDRIQTLCNRYQTIMVVVVLGLPSWPPQAGEL